jgi:hypothetical protein
MATTTTSPQVVQSGLGSIGTPTISVGRTQIIEGGKLIGYREVVTVSNPTVINQLVHIALPSGRDPTPQTTYTMDRDLDGKLKSGTMAQYGVRSCKITFCGCPKIYVTLRHSLISIVQ